MLFLLKGNRGRVPSEHQGFRSYFVETRAISVLWGGYFAGFKYLIMVVYVLYEGSWIPNKQTWQPFSSALEFMVFFSTPMIIICPLTGYMCVHILNRDLQWREIDTIADSVFLKRHNNEQDISFFLWNKINVSGM